jgi:hypothetical protein
MGGIDILRPVAIPMESKAARNAGMATAIGGPGISRWEEREVGGHVPYLLGEYICPDDTRLTVGLASVRRTPRRQGSGSWHICSPAEIRDSIPPAGGTFPTGIGTSCSTNSSVPV